MQFTHIRFALARFILGKDIFVQERLLSMRILLIQHGVHGLLELFALIANKTKGNKAEETSTAWTKCKIKHAKVLVQKETTVAYHVVDNNIDKPSKR